MASQTSRSTARKPAGGPQKVGPGGIAPQKRSLGCLVWLLFTVLFLFGLVYLSGRLVEPIRARLAPLPLLGGLFAEPVWPVLWNDPPKPGSDSPVNTQPSQDGQAGPPPQGGNQTDSELAARQAAVEAKEAEVARREAELKTREEALKAREAAIAKQEIRLSQEIKVTEELRKRLEGQLRAEKDRAEVVRSMKPNAAQALFSAMTDDEVVRVLMYLAPEEVGKILAVMEPYRSARILQALRQVGSDGG